MAGPMSTQRRQHSSAPPLPGLLAACVLLALVSCGGGQPLDAWNDAACKKALTDGSSVDAFDWFKDPYGGPKRVGAWSNDEGLAFAHKLELEGATRVFAVGIDRVKGPDPHETARGFVAVLPDDPAKRLGLFHLYAKQVASAGYRAQGDTGQKYLFVPAGR